MKKLKEEFPTKSIETLIFINRSRSIWGSNVFDYSETTYINDSSLVKLRCIEHDAIFEQTAHQHLLHENGCPICHHNLLSYINTKEYNPIAVENRARGNRSRYTTELFIKKSIEKYGIGRFKYDLCNYISDDIPVILFCEKCKKYFSVKPSYHLSINCSDSGGCQNCSVLSKGELRIKEFFEIHNIDYVSQKRLNSSDLDGCPNSRYIFVDFQIILNNKIIFIEYNGIQHYEPVSRFGGLDNFERVTKRDNSLKEYCKQNNIIFLEIPYTDFKNINKILENLLDTYLGKD